VNKKRRPFVETDRWRLVVENLSTPGKPLYKGIPRFEEPDARVESALRSPGKSVAMFRCGAKGCGYMLGQVIKTADEGLLALVYDLRPDPFQIQMRRFLPAKRRIAEELEARVVFLDEVDCVTTRCWKHGQCDPVAVSTIKAKAARTRSWRSPTKIPVFPTGSPTS
jgi:hypothetical protein